VLSLQVILLAYLIGSIPFGYLIVRARRGADVRESGSGGTGATNVSRQAGKAAGVLTLLLDALKGAVAVLSAQWLIGAPLFAASNDWPPLSWLVSAAAVAVIVGHCFPVWLGFRGGKGVATALGAFLVLIPTPVVLAMFVFLPVVLLTRYVSLASILAALSMPFFVFVQIVLTHGDVSFLRAGAVLIGAVLIVFAHRANISRLYAGTENKFK
jgi:acyl phosphate:glycerol-3-phosphate acyltransferase